VVARIDWTVIAIAAGVGLAVIVPGALASGVLADQAGSWVVWLFLGLVVVGFTLSGVVAGHLRSDTPMVHGALGAAVAFLGALAVGLVSAALHDRSLSVAAVPLAALLAVTAGVGGSLLADLVDRRAIRR
jgi:hypothetical protein